MRYKDKQARAMAANAENLASSNNAQLATITPQVNGIQINNTNIIRSISVTCNETIVQQPYLGGYMEVQPDSWDGTTPATDSVTKTWGFPISLLPTERAKIKANVFNGEGTNIMYIRFPLGFGYRGFLNIDSTTQLAKNIGQRFTGQNETLSAWFSNISNAGGGLAPEYWCPAPYWVTSGTYYGANQLRAGGSYAMTVTLQSIKTTNPTQYNAQITAFTNAIISDLEYLHQNIAPVRMFALQNEPTGNQELYGACSYDAQTYNDVLAVLYPKFALDVILSTYNQEPNVIKLLVASSYESNPFTGVANTFIVNYPSWIWGYTHHLTRNETGESYLYGAEWYKTSGFSSIKGSLTNVITNEYEYFTNDYGTDDFRCSNNMLHLINEAVYGNAQILHPIIHICKPIGQSMSSTNTRGYCLYEANLSGSYALATTDPNNPDALNGGCVTPNLSMYNSWAMFGDNLPVGAQLVGSYSTQIFRAGWCVYKYEGNLYIFLANNSPDNVSISITFSTSKLFNGLMYSLEHCGDKIISQTGSAITFVIPAYSGQAWIEEGMIQVSNNLIISSNNVIVSDTFTRANNSILGNTQTGQPWLQNGYTTWSIFNDYLTGVSIGNNGVAYVNANKSDCTISCNVLYQGYASIAFRITDCSNHYRLRFSPSGCGLFSVVGSIPTLIESVSNYLTVGTIYNIKVALLDTAIQCYVNDILLINATDSTYVTQTNHGIYYPVTGCGDTYDNFLITV